MLFSKRTRSEDLRKEDQMTLEIPIRSREPKSTLTRDESQPVELGSRRRDDDIEFRPPPAHLLLDVVMTFSGTMPRLSVPEAGIVAEGSTIEEAFSHLIEATGEWLSSSDDRRAALRSYPPETWFRFVPPGERRMTLTERFNAAYDEDARREDEEFFRTTEAYYRRRFNAED
jgi:hypothetical protein